MIVRVISGGQTGADQAALRAARAHGVLVGGWVPRGWRTDDGPAPYLKTWGLREHESSAYPPRTELNVRQSGGTIIFGNPLSQGCVLTRQLCERLGRPYFHVGWPHTNSDENARVERAFRWVQEHNVRVLNGAGNREVKNPGIGAAAFAFFSALLVLDGHPQIDTRPPGSAP